MTQLGFRGWAVTIARHRAVDYARRQHRQPVTGDLPAELAEVQSCDDTAGSAIETMATRDALAMIAKLPRYQAEAVLLRVVVGLDAKTAGKVLGKRAGAVRTAAYRGLRTLAGYVGEPGGTPGAAGAAERKARPVRVTQTPASALKDMR